MSLSIPLISHVLSFYANSYCLNWFSIFF